MGNGGQWRPVVSFPSNAVVHLFSGLIAWGAQDAAHRRRGLGAQTAERVSTAHCDE